MYNIYISFVPGVCALDQNRTAHALDVFRNKPNLARNISSLTTVVNLL